MKKHQVIGLLSTGLFFLGTLFFQFVPAGGYRPIFDNIVGILVYGLIFGVLSLPFFIKNAMLNRFLPTIAIVILTIWTFSMVGWLVRDPIVMIQKLIIVPLVVSVVSIGLLVFRVVKFRKLYSLDSEGGETDTSLKLPGIEGLLKKLPKNFDVLKFKKPALIVGSGIVVLLLLVGAVNLISGLGGGPSQSTSSQSASISVPGYVEVAAASMFDTTTSSIKSLSGRKKFDQPDGSEVWEVTIYYLLPNGGPVHAGPTAISVNK